MFPTYILYNALTSVVCTALFGKVLVFERGPLVFVLNWSPTQSYEAYKVRERMLLVRHALLSLQYI